MKGDEGKFSIEKTFFSTLKTSLIKSKSIVNKEKKIMEKNKISCVISDGRISPIVAAGYYLGLPVLYVTNLISIRKQLLKRRVDKFLITKPLNFATKTAALFSDEIIIPDFPSPNNVCHYLLSNRKRIKKKISFVGPLVNQKLYKSKSIKTRKKTILALVGGHEYRKPLIDHISEVSELNKNLNFIIISRLIKKEKRIGNLTLLPFVKNLYPYLKACDIVITQSGHSTVMEILCSGKISILIPDKNQYEQEAIAKRVKELQLGESIDYDKISSKLLLKKIENLVETKEYNKNVKKLSKLCRKINGQKKVADMAIKYSSRILS
jgi:uncharacterized protein (TIGR00661 family)